MEITAYQNFDRNQVILDLKGFETRWLSSRFYKHISPQRVSVFLKLGLIEVKPRWEGKLISYRLTRKGDAFISNRSYCYQRQYKQTETLALVA